jgi:hypothetical protein
LVLAGSVRAQSNCVKVKFEVDNKEITSQDFKVKIYADGQIIEPVIYEHNFIVPPEVKNYEKVDVRFLFGKYNLFFDSVHVSAFQTDWVIGIDSRPFDEENIASSNDDTIDKDLLLIYYIDFIPKNQGAETRLVIKVYKNMTPLSKK